MLPVSLLLSTLFLAVPGEYVIDTGMRRVGVETEIVLVVEARDGSQFKIPAGLSFRADSDAYLDVLVSGFQDAPEWQVRMQSKTTFVISGTRTSPIRSLTISSNGWKPDVSWRPTAAPKK
jgi:hypothetical protein